MSRLKKGSVPACKTVGRPKACEAETRINDLMETARHLILKNGYTKVSLQAIARAAHVAVRTIYVKFGGKAGLLKAILTSHRARYLQMHDIETDMRPFKVIIDDFARDMLDLLASNDAICMQRVVFAEAPTNPDLAETFYDGGPKLTRQQLSRFFVRPDIRAQLHPDLPFDQLPTLLLNCIGGDHVSRFLLAEPAPSREQALRQLEERLAVFYRGVLRTP